MRFARLELDAPQHAGPSNGFGTAGNPAEVTFFLPTGIALKDIELIGQNVNNDQVQRVVLELNADDIVSVSGEFLRKLQAYKGEYQEDGVFKLPFADFSQELQAGQNLSQLVLEPGDNAVLKLYIGEPTAQQTTDGDIASFRGNYRSVPMPPQGRTVLPRMFSESFNGSVAGENRYTNFVNQRKSNNPTSIRRAHFIGDNLDKLELKRSGRTIFKRRKSDWNREVKEWGLTPQTLKGAAVFHFDPTVTGFGMADKLDTDGSFEIITTLATAGGFECVYETVELVKMPQPQAS